MRKRRIQGARLFVLDTNVLMHDPGALFRFKEHDVFLPMAVLEELDAAEGPRGGLGQQPPRRGSGFDLDPRGPGVGLAAPDPVDATEVDHRPPQAAVAHQQIGAATDEVHRDLRRGATLQQPRQRRTGRLVDH